jgi:hypothetical protein
VVPESESAQANNVKTAFNFFVAKGLSKVQAAGIVGNLMQESNVIPTAVQYGGGPGRGIAQWSVGARWNGGSQDAVATYASEHGMSRWGLTTQLDFIWFELTKYGYGYAQLRAATTVTAATLAFQDRYEICGACDQTTRINYAQHVLSEYGGSGGSPVSAGAPAARGCYSDTLGREAAANACVQSKYDGEWYQCDSGEWIDRWTDPTACSSVHPL